MVNTRLWGQHVLALLWKNFQLAKRRPTSFLYIIAPIIMMQLTLKLRQSLPITHDLTQPASPEFGDGDIILFPNNSFTQNLLTSINHNRSIMTLRNTYRIVESEQDFRDMDKENVYIGLSIDSYESNESIEYKIFASDKTLLFSEISLSSLGLFVKVQNLLFNQLFSTNTSVQLNIIPREPFLDSHLASTIALSYMFLASNAVNSLVQDKSDRVREGLLMFGVHDTVWAVSWALYYTIPALLQAPLCVWPVRSLFTSNDLLPIIIIFLLFPISLFAFAYMMSALFDKPKLAVSALSFITSIGSVALYYLAVNLSSNMQILSSLFSPAALALTLQSAFKQRSLQVLRAGFPDTLSGQEVEWFGLIGVWTGITLLLFDTILYCTIGWYLHNVIPSQYGTKKSLIFPIKKDSSSSSSTQQLLSESCNTINASISSHKFERAPAHAKPGSGVCVRKLRKTFSGGQVIAVDGVDVDMYMGEVFALLGHNGAGKTTLIDMLTGLYTPDDGICLINGLNIHTNMERIRESLGVCPQHNILFDRLSVRQHLNFYTRLKRSHHSITPDFATADELMRSLGLESKLDCQAKDLSGGQKRKLSVAIAFLGGSKVVVLDEPSSGMDIEARRSLWATIKRFKAGRVILLTTHQLSEAKLAERIGIMAHGVMQCSGSPLFLSRCYGTGFTLTISCDIESSNCTTQCNRVCELISHRVPNATLMSSAGGETMFKMPFETRQNLPSVFRELDNARDSHGVVDYAVGSTTLESIFLEVALEADRVKDADDITHVTETPDEKKQDKALILEFNQSALGHAYDVGNEDSTRRCSSFLTQLQVMMCVRWASIRRDANVWIYIIITPLMFAVLLQLYNTSPSIVPEQTTAFTVSSIFGNTFDPVYTVSGSNLNLASPSSMLSIDDVQSLQDFHYQLALAAIKVPRLRAAFYQNDLNANDASTVLFMSSSGTALASAVYYNAFWSSFGDVKTSIELWSEGDLSRIRSSLQIIMKLLLLGLFLLYLPPIICSDNVRLRQTKVQLQLLLNGASIAVYWLAAVILGILVLCLPVSMCVVLFELAIDWNTSWLMNLCLLMLAFICSSPPFVYSLTLWHSSESSATIFIRTVYFITGPLLFIGDIGVQALLNTSSGYEPTAIFNIFPAFGVFNGLFFLVFADSDDSLWTSSVTHNAIIIMFISAILWSVLLLAVEIVRHSSKLRSKLSFRKHRIHDLKESADSDVMAETNRVRNVSLNDSDNTMLVCVDTIHKIYEPLLCGAETHAVNGVSFGVRGGECFGLLGTNGSGKTSIMKMLIGEITLSGGAATICDQSISNGATPQGHIAYCAQFDSLIPGLSARRHLTLFGQLIGINQKHLQREVECLIAAVGLTRYASKPADTYSGGNKRKLSAALAMLGGRQVVFLDEPSTGIDPASRRMLWDVISTASSNPRRCIVLTTQSLDECEALCSRLSIMVDGDMQCIGSAHHLKKKFGNMLQLEVNITSIDELEKATAFINTNIQDAEIVEQYDTHIIFSMPRALNSLANVFEILESEGTANGIEEYQVQETSLEQIFLRMAANASTT